MHHYANEKPQVELLVKADAFSHLVAGKIADFVAEASRCRQSPSDLRSPCIWIVDLQPGHTKGMQYP